MHSFNFIGFAFFCLKFQQEYWGLFSFLIAPLSKALDFDEIEKLIENHWQNI